MGKLLVWIAALRAPFFSATVIPVSLGAAVAWAGNGAFDLPLFLLTLAGALCLHAGTNMMNDYHDYKSGCDLHPQYDEFWAPFFGGSRLLPQGILKPREVYVAASLSLILGSIIGMLVALQTGWIIILLGLVGVFSGYFYVRHLSSRGLGELFVFLNFGPLMTLGSYYAQTRMISLEPLIASLPVGFLIAAVLWVNEIPDFPADRAVGKNTLVVRMGRKKAADVYIIILGMSYLSVTLGAIGGYVPVYALTALISLPLAAKAAHVARKHHDDPSRMISANVRTVQLHIVNGLLIALGYILGAIA